MTRMADSVSNSSRFAYPPSLATMLGRKLTRRDDPLDSSGLSDADLLEAITASKPFAREFVASGLGLAWLTTLERPHELRRFPNATDAVISKLWLALELTARLTSAA